MLNNIVHMLFFDAGFRLGSRQAVSMVKPEIPANS